MRAPRFEEEAPEPAPFRVKHAEVNRDAQKRGDRFEAVILVCFGHVLWRALQRIECARDEVVQSFDRDACATLRGRSARTRAVPCQTRRGESRCAETR